jgi:hypothetical protein
MPTAATVIKQVFSRIISDGSSIIRASISLKYLRDCPAIFVWLQVVSFDRSPLKGEAPRFSADFNHHLSFKEAL